MDNASKLPKLTLEDIDHVNKELAVKLDKKWSDSLATHRQRCAGFDFFNRVAHNLSLFEKKRNDILHRIPNIRYARTITSTYSFDLPGDLLELDPTVYHMELDRMEELAQAFLKLEPEKPQLFYIWGHAYELDAAADDTFWLRIERIFFSLAGRDDIFYGTNREVLLDMPGPKQ